MFPKKYPEFKVKFDELCKVGKDKTSVELNMVEIDEICSSYAQILDIFPELKNYDYRSNQTL